MKEGSALRAPVLAPGQEERLRGGVRKRGAGRALQNLRSQAPWSARWSLRLQQVRDQTHRLWVQAALSAGAGSLGETLAIGPCCPALPEVTSSRLFLLGSSAALFRAEAEGAWAQLASAPPRGRSRAASSGLAFSLTGLPAGQLSAGQLGSRYRRSRKAAPAGGAVNSGGRSRRAPPSNRARTKTGLAGASCVPWGGWLPPWGSSTSPRQRREADGEGALSHNCVSWLRVWFAKAWRCNGGTQLGKGMGGRQAQKKVPDTVGQLEPRLRGRSAPPSPSNPPPPLARTTGHQKA